MASEYTLFSGNVPENYEQYLGPFLFEPYAVDLVMRINATDIKRVLEIACGTGRVTKHLRSVLPQNIELIATDINADMLETARQRLDGNNIKFMQTEAQALPFNDNSFDLIVCQFGFMFVSDKPKAFSEAYRVLRRGGSLLFSTWDKLEKNIAPYLVNEAVVEFFKKDVPPFFSYSACYER